MSTDSLSLNDSDLRVAHAMGIDPKAVAALKYAHGRGGLAGVALFANPDGSKPYPGKRASSPYPDAPAWAPSNPGAIESEEDDADDGLPDFKTNLDTAMEVTFPDGTGSRSRRKKGAK